MPDEVFNQSFGSLSVQTREEISRFRDSHSAKTVRVKQHDWEYIDCGSGDRTLVVVPGGLRRPQVGWRLMTELEKHFRIVAPSYPLVCTMGELVEGVVGILDHEGIHSFAVLGSSYGGLVVQCIIHAMPDRVTHAIIANTGTLTSDPSIVKRLRRGLRLAQIMPSWVVNRVALRSFKGLLTRASEDQREEYEGHLNEIFANGWLTKREFVCHFKGLLDFHKKAGFSVGDLDNSPVKILLVMSTEDAGVDPRASDALRTMYPTAKVHVFEGEGHLPSVTRTLEYARMVMEFLAY